LGSGFFWVLWFLWVSWVPCLQDTLTNVPGKRKTFETEKQHKAEICMATEMEMGGVGTDRAETAITTPMQFYGALSYSARKQNKKERNHQL